MQGLKLYVQFLLITVKGIDIHVYININQIVFFLRNYIDLKFPLILRVTTEKIAYLFGGNSPYKQSWMILLTKRFHYHCE